MKYKKVFREHLVLNEDITCILKQAKSFFPQQNSNKSKMCLKIVKSKVKFKE
jgi:hypothetical protein